MPAGWICPNNHFWRAEATDVTVDHAPHCATCGEIGRSLDPSAATVEADETAAATPAAAIRVPGYEIVGELGRGGMGVVYKAREERLNRVVALKMILAGGHAADRDLARFRREVEAVAALQHPNIVQIYSVGEADGLPYCALEYVPGGTLADTAASGPLPPRRAAQLVAVLARAVQAAHARDVVHRDLKPSNVLLTEDGTPKIADFGLAKRLGADATGATATGAFLGTPSYMAPEQTGETPNAIGPPADVYALGAILYRLLTGRPPFAAATSLETVRKVLHEEPVPPRRLNASVPRDLETVCLMCLRKEPGKRYATASDLADDLDRFLAGEPVRARPLGVGERLLRLGRRHRPALIGAGAASALILLIIAFRPSQPISSSVPEQVRRAQADVAGGEWFVKAGRFSGPAWGTNEDGILVTSIEFLGMLSPDSPRPPNIEVLQKPGQSDEHTFAAVVETVDRNMRVARLRLGKDTPAAAARPAAKAGTWPMKSKSAKPPPRDFPPAVVDRARKSAVLIRPSAAEGARPHGSGWVAEKQGDVAYVLTNAHVIGMKEPARPVPDKIDVVFDSGLPTESIRAGRLLSLDREEDLAVIRIKGGEMPDPLPIVPFEDLFEGQKLLALGFPRGPALGLNRNIGPPTAMSPTVKARPTVVVGRIMEKDGGVKYIQLEGGIDPGMSGSPLIDTNGNVIGFVVAGDPASQLRLATPSEYVLHLLQGRLLAIQPGQAVVSGGSIMQPLRATIADPLERLAKVTADAWTGKPGRPRPAPPVGEPKAVAGDGRAVTIPLAYDATRLIPSGESHVATAEATLAPLKDGEVYWFRPHYQEKDGSERWGDAIAVEMGRFPVERTPAMLAVKLRDDPAPRDGHEVIVESGQRIHFDIDGVAAAGGDRGVRVRLTERVGAVAANGDAKIRLRYTDVNVPDSGDDAAVRRSIRDVFPSIKGVETEVTLTRDGRYRSPKLILDNVPEAARPAVRQFDDQAMRAIDMLGVDLPGKETQAGETWPMEMSHPLKTPGGDSQTAQFLMTCKYVGRRVRNGRHEAVIELAGVARTPVGERGRPGRGVSGDASGALVVDVATGQTILGRLDCNLAVLFPYTMPNPQQAGQGIVRTVHAGVHLDMTVRRGLTGDDPSGLDPSILLPQRTVQVRPLVGVGNAP